jgi:hypothetical protein
MNGGTEAEKEGHSITWPSASEPIGQPVTKQSLEGNLLRVRALPAAITA